MFWDWAGCSMVDSYRFLCGVKMHKFACLHGNKDFQMMLYVGGSSCMWLYAAEIFLLGTCLLDPMPKTNRYHCAHLDSDKLNVCIVIKPSDKTENGLKMCQAALDISTIMHLLWLRQQESNGEQITWYEDSSTSTQEKALLFQIFFDEVNWQVTV